MSHAKEVNSLNRIAKRVLAGGRDFGHTRTSDSASASTVLAMRKPPAAAAEVERKPLRSMRGTRIMLLLR